MAIFESPLLAETPDGWVSVVLEGFDDFLQDHAACERKASALAMSMIAKYPDRGNLIEPMVALAREELEHFHQVYKVMAKRGISLSSKDQKDPYVNAILKELRHGREERFLDRLVMAALVEARGFERFGIIADNLQDPELKSFYRRIADSEAGHYQVFIRIAKTYFKEDEVDEAVERVARIEAQAMLETPFSAALH